MAQVRKPVRTKKRHLMGWLARRLAPIGTVDRVQWMRRASLPPLVEVKGLREIFPASAVNEDRLIF